MNKITKSLRKIFSLFIPNKKWRHLLVDGRICQYLQWKYLYKKNSTNYKYNFSVLLMIKNAAQYMDEWINYHKLVGVEHFYIFNNESTDNLREVLDPYIKSGLVTYKYWKGTKQQVPAYNYALRHYREETKYLAFIDDDEFIVPIKDKTIPEFISSIEKQYDETKLAGIALSWIMYGTSGKQKSSPELVIKRFTMREKEDAVSAVKTIVRTRNAYAMEPHLPVYDKNFCVIDENLEQITHHIQGKNKQKIRINHYQIKSVEEFLRKKIRGDIYYGKGFKENEEYIKNVDKSCTIQDNIMEKYITPVEQMISTIRKK